MGQIAWSKAPSLRMAVTVPDPPPVEDVAVQDWMKLAKEAIDALATGNVEMQEFLDDLLDAIRPLQLIAGDVIIASSDGSPEGVVTANIGSLYLRNDGGAATTLYVKTSGTGNTGWTAK